MAETSPWVGWLVVGTIAFVIGRGCQPDEPQDLVAAPLYDPASDASAGTATAGDAAMDAAAAAGDAGAYTAAAPEPLYASQPTYEPTPAYMPDSFANCSEARAAGAAPVHAGDPGYARRLDRDGDGVGCE